MDLNTLVVDFRDDVTAEMLAANPYIEQPVSRYSAVDRLYRIHFASAEEARRAAQSLRHDPSVETVDYEVRASIPEPPNEIFRSPPSAGAECMTNGDQTQVRGFPNDPCYRYQWHLRQLRLPEAWKLGQGRGVVVAVIDTGVTPVPDLKGAQFVAGYNFVADNDNAADDHGHGTHVAGTIAQSTHNALGVGGVAFGAAIMPLKVLSAQGSGSMSAIAQAIRWAADHGAAVINMSLGGPLPVTTIRNAVDYARKKGVVVVAAAGNDGRGRVSFPARYPGVFAVAATQFDESTTFYSNWGKEIDIAAPGGNVRVDQDNDGKPDGVLQNTVVPGDIKRSDYLWFMGTSMASPHVAGVAALVIGAGVTRPDAVEAVLLETARKPKPLDGKDYGDGKKMAGRIDDRYGAGIVDAKEALQKARLGRGAGSLGLAACTALLGVGALRRRRRLGARVGAAFVGALLFGASGLFFVPALVGINVPLVTTGALDGAAALLGPAAFGNPLLFSALLPLGLVALLYGVKRLRAPVAGLAFGVAGALLFAALSYVADVRFVPDLLDRAYLAANATVAALLGVATLRR